MSAKITIVPFAVLAYSERHGGLMELHSIHQEKEEAEKSLKDVLTWSVDGCMESDYHVPSKFIKEHGQYED